MYVNSHTTSNYALCGVMKGFQLVFPFHHSSISSLSLTTQVHDKVKYDSAHPHHAYQRCYSLKETWVREYFASVANDISYVHICDETFDVRSLVHQMFHSLLGSFVNNKLAKIRG